MSPPPPPMDFGGQKRPGWDLYYRKHGSAPIIVREVRSVRERERDTVWERERERERDGSDVTIVALKLAMSSHFPLPKNRTFRFSIHTARLSLLKWSPFGAEWIKLIPKTIRNRKKRLCVKLRSGDKHHLRKSSDRKAQIREAFFPPTGLICAFRSEDFLRWCLSPKRNLTHDLFFLFPIFFGINCLRLAGGVNHPDLVLAEIGNISAY